MMMKLLIKSRIDGYIDTQIVNIVRPARSRLFKFYHLIQSVFGQKDEEGGCSANRQLFVLTPHLSQAKESHWQLI